MGEETDYAGKILVSMAGGLGRSPEAILTYFEEGIGTIVMMHCAEETLHKVARQNLGNIIVAGHMGSDSIGMNFILGKVEEQGVEVVRTSGLMEVKRS